jgi:hypothetical protein
MRREAEPLPGDSRGEGEADPRDSAQRKRFLRAQDQLRWGDPFTALLTPARTRSIR